MVPVDAFTQLGVSHLRITGGCHCALLLGSELLLNLQLGPAAAGSPWPPDPRRSASVAEQRSGIGIGLLVVLDGDLAIDEHPAIPPGSLDPAPLTTRQIVGDLARLRLEVLVVVDDDVGRTADPDGAAVPEPGE